MLMGITFGNWKSLLKENELSIFPYKNIYDDDKTEPNYGKEIGVLKVNATVMN